MMSAFRLSRSLIRLSPPAFHSAASAAVAAAGGERHVKNRLLVTVCSPSDAAFVKQPAQSVTVPGVEGAMTVTNNHSQLVAQLRNGVVSVKVDGSEEPKSFFLSDGFLFYEQPKDDSGCCTAEVVGVEILPLEFLEKERAAQVLQEVLQEGQSSSTPWERARAQLGSELCSAVIREAKS